MPPPTVSLPSNLVRARFLRRPNRFVVHARLDEAVEHRQGGGPDAGGGGDEAARGGSLLQGTPGDEVVCHLPDPGRLNELLIEGKRLWLRPADRPSRKTDYSVLLVETPDGEGVVSVDTTLPNRLIRRALERNALDELGGWRLERAEFARGGSRFDFLLSDGDGRRLVMEVKSVTLVEGGEALFPDAVTARGARHVRELAEIAAEPGWEAAVLFVLQRDDADRIRAARSIDPDFADALAEAKEAGVRVLGRRCRVTRERVVLGEPVPAT